MKLLNAIKDKVQNFFSFMSPMSWMGVAAFAFGFFVGSEGEWAGTLFFSAFWMVGVWMYTQWSSMNK